MSCLCPALHSSGCPGLEPATIRNKMQCIRLIVLCTDCILTWTYFEKIFSTVILYILVWWPGDPDWSSVDLCNGSLTTVWWQSCIILCFFRLDLLLYLALVCASSVHWFRTLGGHKLQRCAHVSNVYPGLVQHRAQTSNVDIGLEILRLMANLDYQRENNGRLNRPKMQT